MLWVVLYLFCLSYFCSIYALSGEIHINPVPPPPGSDIPYWEGLRLHPAHALFPNHEPFGGAKAISNTTYVKLLHATPETGTYNHAAMIAFDGIQFLAYWKNSPTDEDEAGQRILYSQSYDDGMTWSNQATDGEEDQVSELFPPLVSESNPNVALFAEPTIFLNGHLYAAASPHQFCLYPIQADLPDGASVENLLLRRVYIGKGEFSSIFWATGKVPGEYAEASDRLGILTIDDMDDVTQKDLIPWLADQGASAPCDQNITPKCEWCKDGCHNTTFPDPIENERAYYKVPPTVGEKRVDDEVATDVILYRSRVKNQINHLYASTRHGNTWSEAIETNIADDVSNLNAGNLPDGRAYVVSNVMPNVVRDPLYVSLSVDGFKFNETFVVASCEMPEFQPKEDENRGLGSRWGCQYRYKGGSKQGGCQYPQAMPIVQQAGNASGFWVIFSVNKEDIWIAKVPLTF